jgi:hypothetical protein
MIKTRQVVVEETYHACDVCGQVAENPNNMAVIQCQACFREGMKECGLNAVTTLEPQTN